MYQSPSLIIGLSLLHGKSLICDLANLQCVNVCQYLVVNSTSDLTRRNSRFKIT